MSRPWRLLPDASDSPASQLLSSSDAQRIIERAIKLSKADEIEVNFNSNHTGNTRFAANQMSTAGSVTNQQLVIQSNFGAKHAVVTTNDFSDASLERAVRSSGGARAPRARGTGEHAAPRRAAVRAGQRLVRVDRVLTPDARSPVRKGALDRSAGPASSGGLLVIGERSGLATARPVRYMETA